MRTKNNSGNLFQNIIKLKGGFLKEDTNLNIYDKDGMEYC